MYNSIIQLKSEFFMGSKGFTLSCPSKNSYAIYY